MTLRHIHYEVAFEDYLRSRGVPYVPVDETRRAVFDGTKIKSFDMLVYPNGGPNWIVDVKGRKFPYINEDGAKHYWENWVEREDLDGLTQWQHSFGEDFEARFVFAYLLDGPPDRWPQTTPHRFRDELYCFFTVTLSDYKLYNRQRSPSWQTVTVPTKTFRQIIQPVEAFLNGK